MDITANSSRMYVEEDRTFFCSELVAKAYKVFGVLENKQASSYFLPSTLENDQQLKFSSGAQLGKLINIVPSSQ